MFHHRAHFDRTSIAQSLTTWAFDEFPDIHQTETKRLIETGLTEIERYENAALDLALVDSRAAVLSDKSAVWILSGPSLYTFKYTERSNEKWSRYETHPLVRDQKGMYQWIQSMEPQRVDAGVNLIQKATARIAGVPLGDVTLDHIRDVGPRFVYNGMKIQNDAFYRSVLIQQKQLPDEKVYMFHEFADGNNARAEISNTKEQVLSFHLPESTKTDRLAVITHGAHFARFAYLLQSYTDVIPEGIELYGLPLPTPKEYLQNYAMMEMKGIIQSWCKGENSAALPYPIRLAC